MTPYSDEFLSGLREIKEEYHLTKMILSFCHSRIPEFVFLSYDEVDKEMLSAIDIKLAELVDKVTSAEGIAEDAFCEVSLVDMNEIKKDELNDYYEL